MKRAVKAEFLQALRSGRYTQTNFMLRDGDGSCCLGVLTDLCPKIKWQFVDRACCEQEAFWEDEEGNGCSEQSFLPAPVVEWAGIKGAMPDKIAVSVNAEVIAWLKDHGVEWEKRSLMADRKVLERKFITLDMLNDSYEFDFPTIADFVERFVPEEE